MRYLAMLVGALVGACSVPAHGGATMPAAAFIAARSATTTRATPAAKPVTQVTSKPKVTLTQPTLMPVLPVVSKPKRQCNKYEISCKE